MNMELIGKANNNTVFLVSKNPNSIESFLISIPKLPATMKKLTIDFRFDINNFISSKILTNLNKQNILNLYNNISENTCLLIPVFESFLLNNILNTKEVNDYKMFANKISEFINSAYEILNRQKILVDSKVLIKSSTNIDFGFLNWFYQTFPKRIEYIKEEKKEVIEEEVENNNNKDSDTSFNFVVGIDESGKPVVADDSRDKSKIIEIKKEKIENPYVKPTNDNPPENIIPTNIDFEDSRGGYANYVLLGSLIFLCAVFITFLLITCEENCKYTS